ncbi:MAG: hypothetical protein OSA99_07820 [Acidimicrobiales bacterium]|nr:hypothetical protein [Acidimicrobiales bacterium]
MLVVAIVLAAAVVALLFVDRHRRGRVEELTDLVVQARNERDQATADAEAAAVAAADLTGERDEAHERENRARRDAADIANRLRDETAAKSELESSVVELQEQLDAAALDDDLLDVLWTLSVRESRRRWWVSVSVGPEAASPLDAARDPFRAAVEVEVDAAREESGAALDLVWKGESPCSGERAVLALALVRDVIGALGTAAVSTTITVDSGDDAVNVQIDATDADGLPVDVWIPPSLEVEPGRARIS